MVSKKDYFDHDADIGIIGRGPSIEAAFIAAGESVFNIMVNTDAIHPKQFVPIDFIEEDLELALVVWLNELLNASRCNGLIFGKFELHKHQNHWQGKAWGEPWRDELIKGTEVKGATLTMLSVKNIGEQWEARCVVDV